MPFTFLFAPGYSRPRLSSPNGHLQIYVWSFPFTPGVQAVLSTQGLLVRTVNQLVVSLDEPLGEI